MALSRAESNFLADFFPSLFKFLEARWCLGYLEPLFAATRVGASFIGVSWRFGGWKSEEKKRGVFVTFVCISLVLFSYRIHKHLHLVVMVVIRSNGSTRLGTM